MDICYPDSTDWSATYTDQEIVTLRNDVVNGPKIAVAEALAWSLLASLCAYQIGTCPVTIRPCVGRCAPGGTWLVAPVSRGNTTALPVGTIGRLNPYISGGRWYNACGHRTGCDCTSLPSVALPGPVGRIVSVYVDGALLPSTAYHVVNGGELVRTDGGEWPICQDMALPDSEGFSVTYYRGAAPNVMTNRAAGALAYEFYQDSLGKECRLPTNLTRANVQGASYEFEPMDFPEGRTGLPVVDAVIRIYNPFGAKAPVSIASPDTIDAGAKVKTWSR